MIARIGSSADGRWPEADAVIDAHRQVRHAGHRQHAHALARGACRSDPDSVRAQPLSRRRASPRRARSAATSRRRSSGAPRARRTQIVAPRIVLYPMLRESRSKPGQAFNRTPAEYRALVRAAKERGADGIKLIGPMDRDQAAAALDEAKKVGLPTTVHIAVGEATARDFVDDGVNCIEHFYGVADAALDGIQDFPPEMNLANEIHRFGRAGELYTQENLDHAKLSKLLDDMVAKGRRVEPDDVDLRGDARPDPRAEPPVVQGLPAPVARGVLQAEHGAARHLLDRLDERPGSAVAQELPGLDGGAARVRPEGRHDHDRRRRRVSVRIAVRLRIIRELELHHEAGFHPLEVLRHATSNGAKVLGLQDRLGRIRPGFIADLLVVNGNPLENLRLLNPYGTDLMSLNGQIINNYSGSVKPGDPNVEVGPRRRHRVDDQGRHSVSRADADEGSQGHGRAGSTISGR